MATAAAPTTEGSIFCVALDGSAGSGKTALREALFGQSFKEEKISNEIVKFTSNFARLVVYELQGAEGSKGRLTALTELMAAAKTQIHVYWYLYDASSPTVFTADLLEGTNNDAYLHTQIILTKADALSQAQLNTLKTSIEDKIKNASWVKAKDAYPVVTQRKLVFDAECPKCSSKNLFVNHKQLRWMCSECNGTGSFPASQNLAPLLTATTKALPDKLQPYFVGAQQADSTYKQTFAVEIIKKAAEEGMLVSGVSAVERITKALWVDLALVMPTPSGIAAKLIRLMSFSMWLSSLSERIGWVIAELVHKSKNPWTIATSGLMVARLLWLAVNSEYKLHSDPFLAEQGAQLHDLILKALDGPRDLSRNVFYLRLHAIVDDQYMDLWQHVNKADGYETCETFVWSWKMADFTPNRSTDAVLGDLLKGHHLPPTDHFSALAPIYLQRTTPQVSDPVASQQVSSDPLVPVPFSPAPIPVVARITSPKP